MRCCGSFGAGDGTWVLKCVGQVLPQSYIQPHGDAFIVKKSKVESEAQRQGWGGGPRFTQCGLYTLEITQP